MVDADSNSPLVEVDEAYNSPLVAVGEASHSPLDMGKSLVVVDVVYEMVVDVVSHSLLGMEKNLALEVACEVEVGAC